LSAPDKETDMPDVPIPCAPDPSVAERLITEGLIDLPTAAKLLPPIDGRPMAPGSLWRWITRGKAGTRLEGFRFHDEWWTSRGAVARFLATVTASA
jgi:hypothetical protein